MVGNNFNNIKLLGLIALFNINISFTQQADPDYLDGVAYFKIEESATINLEPYDSLDLTFNQIISDYSITQISKPFEGIGNDTLDLTFKIYFEDTFNVNQLVSEINALSWIDYCEKAPLYKTINVPNDASQLQWYLEKIKAFDAWDISTGSEDVTIAIVDNAVRITHEDLVNNLWVNAAESENGLDSDLNGYTDDINGYDVADSDNNPSPPSSFTGGVFSHGTHCAGTASGSTNNGKGVAGIGYNCSIIGIKCTPDNSNGATLPFAYEGLKYAIDVGADVISMSWGGRASSFTGDALLTSADLNGIVLIAAAGNDNEENALTPASNPNVISVGASDENDLKASFSNYGPDIDLMAPGKSIWNLFGGNDSDYGYSDGTSMACPIVAGAAGLLLSHFPNASQEDIENALLQGCDDIDGLNPGFENKLGSGRLNLLNSFQILEIKENQSTEFEIYPNPCKSYLTLELTESNKQVSDVKIFDLTGRDMTNKTSIDHSAGNNSINIELSSLSSGIYFVSINDSETNIPFVKE